MKNKVVSSSSLLVMFFLLITAILLVAITELRQLDFLRNQRLLMASTTQSTSNEIALLVRKYRDSVTLFAEDNADLLVKLMDDSENDDFFAHLHARVKRHFPNSFGITIAATDGEVLLDDFDGIVGEVCVNDLKVFATTRHPYEIFVHPHAEVYHFDMPVMVTSHGIDIAVFFVSFRLDEIARLLLNGAAPDHRFLLVNANDPQLIEVTGLGSRAELGENIRLDEAPRRSIGFQRAVEGTHWILVDLPDSELFAGHRIALYRQSMVIYLLVLVGSLYAFSRLRGEERTRKQAEQMLREKNEALKQSYAQLQHAQDRLVESEKMASLGGLVAGIAHEINTPVGIAVTAVSTLGEQARVTQNRLSTDSLKRSEIEQFLDTAIKAGSLTESNLQRAAQLIKSFKQIAVDQSSEKIRRFMLGDYVREVMTSLQPELNHTRHRYQIDCPADIEIESYPGAISQIITNLVLNSLQHAFVDGQAGEIRLSIGQGDGMAWLEYSDNGKGVDAESRSRIFEPFYTTARNRGGSGLGLSIVYNLVVQMLAGVVELKDTGGKGFTLHLQIPLRVTAA